MGQENRWTKISKPADMYPSIPTGFPDFVHDHSTSVLGSSKSPADSSCWQEGMRGIGNILDILGHVQMIIFSTLKPLVEFHFQNLTFVLFSRDARHQKIVHDWARNFDPVRY